MLEGRGCIDFRDRPQNLEIPESQLEGALSMVSSAGSLLLCGRLNVVVLSVKINVLTCTYQRYDLPPKNRQNSVDSSA